VGELDHFGGVDRYLYDRVQRLRHGWLDLAEPPPIVCLFCDDFETGDSCEWSETQPPVGCLLAGPRGAPPPGGPTAAQVVERDQEYLFDLYGNIQSIATDGLVVNTPTDSATNRLVSGMGTAYDSRGNLIARPGSVFVYDALDRLVRREATGELRRYHFLYTADDERILTFVEELPGSGGTDQFRWTLRDLGGTVLRDYVSVPGQAALCVAEDYVFRGSSLLGARQYSCDPELPSPPQELHYTLDHLGTPRLVTSESGTVVEERKYFPFGEEAKPANPEGPRLRFTGHERDVFDLDGTEDDLDYMHARVFSPLTGRFLSVDPAGGDPTRPQSWNRYSYVWNNPLARVDPTGTSPTLVSAAIGAAVGGVLGGAGSIAVQLVEGSDFSLQDVGAAAAGGATSGALAGATLGLSLFAEAGVGTVALVAGASNVVGESVTRSLDSHEETQALDAGSALVDFGAGALGGAVGFRAGHAIQGDIAVARSQVQTSLRGARSGNFGAAGSVAGHRSVLQALEGRATAVGVIAGARVSNIGVPIALAAARELVPSHRNSVSYQELKKAH